MTLQASGQIKMSEINVEVGLSASQADSSLVDAVTGGYPYPSINMSSPSYPDSNAPHQFSAWYSYDHDYSSAFILINLEDGIVCSTSSLQISGTYSGGIRVTVVVNEFDDGSPNGSHNWTCQTVSGGTWQTTDWGGFNTGTNSIDIEAYLYNDSSCTGGIIDSDFWADEPCFE